MRSNLIDMPARQIHQTDKAWLLETENKDRVWIAKSASEFDGETLTLPEPLAQEKELI